jgi:hypothetical protein
MTNHACSDHNINRSVCGVPSVLWALLCGVPSVVGFTVRCTVCTVGLTVRCTVCTVGLTVRCTVCTIGLTVSATDQRYDRQSIGHNSNSSNTHTALYSYRAAQTVCFCCTVTVSCTETIYRVCVCTVCVQ